ncbi:LRR repeats and ubiquitin-like domain-containing protein At2g30105 [Impatiens glandulifera]|uniref:LRR repeats and ubiquitin-like domain-containing protein At2g30105 n=1 Tax=Impatiens glandulifera TaxID=253017 RepID=UPI001FB0EDD4|nr:LRR repeats and ubiquitin-like domain-containing protein At2g30105 [Impatiens glandulifera]
MEVANAAGADGDVNTAGTLIIVNIKFSGRSISLDISLDSFVRDLKFHLQPLTNVLPQNQKLIFQGKLLVDDMTLRSSEVINGAKIMLIRSQGLHQGVPPVKRDALASSKLKAVMENQNSENEIRFLKDFEHWKASGVIALSDCLLEVCRPDALFWEDIPDIVYAGRTFATVLDLSYNFLQEVPFAINYFQSLQKLLLNRNELGDDSISWAGLASLKSLTNLCLSHNNFCSLTTLPSTLGFLTSLKQLDVANNKLTCLPSEIGQLPQLEMLMANHNSLSTIPTCIGNCISLVEVNLSTNLLTELPDAFANLHNLKVLTLSNNVDLKYLPKTLFKMCKQLLTLNVYDTEITIDLLRQLEGWDRFELRKRNNRIFELGESAEFALEDDEK